MKGTKTPTGFSLEVSNEELGQLERATLSASNSAKATAFDMGDYPDVASDLTEDSEAYSGLNEQIAAIRETF